MIEVRLSSEFADWLERLRDTAGRARILKRLSRAAGGHLGDVASVGEGVMEMRLFFGPGYRLYYVLRGDVLIVMLCGGDKGSQARDIGRAKEMAAQLD